VLGVSLEAFVGAETRTGGSAQLPTDGFLLGMRTLR
jgi:hypothetical protein